MDTETITERTGGNDIEKTLGLLGEINEDCIGSHLNEKKTPPKVSRNERPPMKSVIMSLFDSLGLVSPLTTPVKRLMQETWLYRTGLDEPTPEELQPR
ncbi:unnamed protein product [Parnassius apollo]|uniref:(apollo) hypothetical protein n=1 Tax=Parnassius apollo TaxID=110799 RepID=A0A8S3WNY2_PARAO|nr:unnamed protein product [Parnassius apollo]